MATRDILDASSNVIGQLTLPDSTAESVWTQQLNIYSTTPTQYFSDDAVLASNFGLALITTILTTLIHPAKSPDVTTYMTDFNNAVAEGSLIVASGILDRYISDTSSDKTALDPDLTNTKLLAYKNQITTYLLGAS